jgi:hypothetical protein
MLTTVREGVNTLSEGSLTIRPSSSLRMTSCKVPFINPQSDILSYQTYMLEICSIVSISCTNSINTPGWVTLLHEYPVIIQH